MSVGFERLRSAGAVRAVFAARCTCASEVAVLHARRRHDEGPARATVVAGKAVGNAVARNRVKRRLREAARGLALAPGTDVVIVGRPAAAEAPFTELRAALTRQVATVGCSR